MTTAIKTCATTQCAFNNNGCTALGITLNEQGTCATFSSLDIRAHGEGNGQISACKRIDCAFNDNLSCTAGAVDVNGETASCATYKAR